MTSFPGYDTATNLFIAWANTLRAQASSWNDLWVKLKDGSFQFSDWTRTMVGSVESLTSFSEQFWYSLWGPAAPPWANLPCPPNAPVPIKILKPVNKDNPIEPVPLTLLGGEQVGEPLRVQVTITGPHELTLFVDDADWQKFERQPGQYVGLVFSRDYIDPVAILSFRVSDADLERVKAVSENIQGIAVLGRNARRP